MAEVDVTAPTLSTTRAPTASRSPAAPSRGHEQRRRGRLRAAAVTLRPRQWVKNTLVIAAAGAAGALGHDDVPVRVGLAFVAFCMLASGIYAINDVRDADEDRLHPRKRLRPVAAGELSGSAAVGLGVGLIVAGLVLCAAIRPLLVLVGGGYVLITLSYTLVWRHLLVFDLLAIAGGFVLRAVAGGVAPPVALSRWFLLVVTGAAVFVAAGKRYAELRRTDAELRRGDGRAGVRPADAGAAGGSARGRRRVLEGYTGRRLRLILLASAALAVGAYVVWALELPNVRGVPWRLLTVVPFVACLGRYGMLIGAGGGEAPEDLVLRDPPLLLAGLSWLVLFALGVHAAG